ncbi:MAG: hypothetical protein B7Z66_05240 [Chromatiales bacterium 21-64-14]|nr:MAG: hypothetical protein B7Z66_05240 [Chromatiales bacterium 21-64-14]HQU15106.1 flagellar hook assembly protein FlgD [Gammaproteobacteria bacterium]
MTSAINTATLQQLGLLQTPPPAASSNSAQLGQSAFLTLMTTQLQNQDPLQPMDNSQFLSQMAQFGTVSGIQGLQTSLTQLSNTLSSSQALQASSLVGRTALVPQNTGLLSTGGVLQGAVTMPAGATGGTVKIYDMSGQLVRSMSLDTPVGGFANFQWNGIEDNGSQAPAGQYQVQTAANIGGTSTALQTLIAAPVDSVILGSSGSGLTLNLGGIGPVALSDVQQIM